MTPKLILIFEAMFPSRSAEAISKAEGEPTPRSGSFLIDDRSAPTSMVRCGRAILHVGLKADVTPFSGVVWLWLAASLATFNQPRPLSPSYGRRSPKFEIPTTVFSFNLNSALRVGVLGLGDDAPAAVDFHLR